MAGGQYVWLQAAARKEPRKGVTMSDQEKKRQSSSISPQPDAEKKKNESTELSQKELNKVAGGLREDPCMGGQAR